MSKSPMSATVYFALMSEIRDLRDMLTSALYGNGRGGQIPPDDIPDVVRRVWAASQTLDVVLRANVRDDGDFPFPEDVNIDVNLETGEIRRGEDSAWLTPEDLEDDLWF